MKEHYVKKVKDKSGIAIMSVMLFFMVMTILFGGLTIYSQRNMNVAGTSADSTAAYYAAEAGINFVVSDFKRVIDVGDGDVTQAQFIAAIMDLVNIGLNRVYLSNNSGQPSYFDLTFKDIESNDTAGTFKFTIVSTGVVNGVARTLETFVDLDYSLGAGNRQGFAVKHALLVKNSISASNGVRITLSPATLANNPTLKPFIATVSSTQGAINFNKTSDYSNGIVELLPGSNNNVTNIPSNQITKTLTLNSFTNLDFEPVRAQAAQVLSNPRYISTVSNLNGLISGNNINSTVSGTYNIPGGSYYIPDIIFNNSTNIVINADSNVLIVTDRLRFQGNVSFTGTGEVKFYVRPKSITSNIETFSILDSINNGLEVGRRVNPHLFIVYVDTTTPAMTVTPGNNSKIFGSFMFNNANLAFSNNVTFGGYLMTGGLTVQLSNNADVFTALYYAPNANVTVLQNGVVRGAIIANNVTLQNGAIVEYEPAFLTNFPFAVESPIVDTTRSDGVHSIVFRIHRTTEQ